MKFWSVLKYVLESRFGFEWNYFSVQRDVLKFHNGPKHWRKLKRCKEITPWRPYGDKIKIICNTTGCIENSGKSLIVMFVAFQEKKIRWILNTREIEVENLDPYLVVDLLILQHASSEENPVEYFLHLSEVIDKDVHFDEWLEMPWIKFERCSSRSCLAKIFSSAAKTDWHLP